MTDWLDPLRAALHDRYEVHGEIGRGGWSVVLEASDRRHHRQVAIKVLHPDLGSLLGAERFLREIQLAAPLSHPHIVSILDSGEAAGLLYYVMPLVVGETLRQRLEREGPLPIEEALRYARQVADALGYAHSHGVIHRDIKPENILLQGRHALLADFGIARMADAGAATAITSAGLAVGTPAYMSPEQDAGEGRVDQRTDLYSLGCVLYEMLAGEPPFSAPNVPALRAKRLMSRPTPVQVLRTTVPDLVSHAITRCLAPTPADRFATAQEFIEALAGADGQRPSHASLPAPPARVGWSRPARLLAAGLVLAGVAGLAVLVRNAGGRGAATDPGRFVVLPCREVSTPRHLLPADECAALLNDALAGWQGIQLVSRLQVTDALARRGNGPLTLDAAVAVARELGAGRLIWPELREVGDSVRVRATVVEVDREGRVAGEHEVTVGPVLDLLTRRFGELAAALVSGDASGASPGTSVYGAWQAFQRGQLLLQRWQVDSAAEEFRRAVALDPAYSRAHLGLARIGRWAGDASGGWRDHAAGALRGAALLTAGEARAARALDALAARRYPQACAAYREMVAADSSDFEGWFGLGDCQGGDPLVQPDATSPSRWRFRASGHAAVAAYSRALRLLPSAHRAFHGSAFDRLVRLLRAEPAGPRWGWAVDARGDTLRFAAWSALDHDTLAFVPHPADAFLRGDSTTVPATHIDAVRRSRDEVLRITRSWADGFPDSPDALEALANALEAAQLLDPPGDPMRSALAVARRAMDRTREPDQRRRLSVAQVRLALKLERWSEARRLADSVLAASRRLPAGEAADLVGVAALTGRAAETARLAAAGASDDSFPLGDRPPAAVIVEAAGLAAYCAFGVPEDTIRARAQRLVEVVRQQVGPTRRAEVERAAFDEPLTLAYPIVGPVLDRDFRPDLVYVQRMWQEIRRGRPAEARQELQRLDRVRGGVGATSVDGLLQEALVLLALGDTAAAVRRLDGQLNALATLPLQLLDRPAEPAALVRAMILRARLAATRPGDDGTRWVAAAAALWQDGDPWIRPLVAAGATRTN